MSSVEPPPTSMTTVPGATSRPAETPRKVRSASSSPPRSARLEAVAPLDLAEERLPVLGVADGARRERERALGARFLHRAPVLGQDVADARDGLREEDASLVHALAEARDLEAPVELADRLRPRRRPRAAASSSCRCRRRRRASLVDEHGASQPADGLRHVADRPGEDGEAVERCAQVLEVRLDRLDPRCSPAPRVAPVPRSSWTRSSKAAWRRSPTVCSRLSERSASSATTLAASTIAAKNASETHVHQGMGRMLSLRSRRGVEQSGSSPGS